MYVCVMFVGFFFLPGIALMEIYTMWDFDFRVFFFLTNILFCFLSLNSGSLASGYTTLFRIQKLPMSLEHLYYFIMQ